MRKWLVLGTIIIVAGIRWRDWNIQEKTQSGYKIDQTAAITLRLSEWPEDTWGGQRIRVKNWDIWLQTPTQLSVGSRVRIVGKISKKVIRGHDIQYILKARDVKILQEKGWRQKGVDLFHKWLPGDLGVLAAGILLGGSEGMSQKGSQNFKNLGLTHIVAASGYNVSVVAGWVMAVGWRILGRRKAIPFVILSIGLYVVLAGGSAAVVRAGLMAAVGFVALLVGRPAQAGWWLAITAGGMITAKPDWLEDVGFQLSFAAMAGLIWVEPKLRGGWQDMKTTVAAQITTIPIILHYFGNLSIVAPMANGLLLWTVPLIMQVSALALGAGMVWEPLGRILIMTVWPLLWLLTESANWIGSQSWAAMTVSRISWWWVILYYLTVVLIINLKPIIYKLTGKQH